MPEDLLSPREKIMKRLRATDAYADSQIDERTLLESIGAEADRIMEQESPNIKPALKNIGDLRKAFDIREKNKDTIGTVADATASLPTFETRPQANDAFRTRLLSLLGEQILPLLVEVRETQLAQGEAIQDIQETLLRSVSGKIPKPAVDNLITSLTATLVQEEPKPEKIYATSATGEMLGPYSSIQQASEIIGVPKGNISECLSGKRKSAGGFVWSRK